MKTADGRTRTLTTKATTKAEARRIVAQSRLAEIEDAARTGNIQHVGIKKIFGDNAVTVPQAVTAFLEWQRNVGRSLIYIAQCQAMLERFIEDVKLERAFVPDITEQHVSDLVNREGKAGFAWRRTQLCIMHAFFDFCAAKGYVSGNPARLVEVRKEALSHVQKEKRERRPFTDKEVAKLLAATKPGSFWHSAIAIGRYTGYRLGDVAQMEWDSFSKPGKVVVHTDKRNKRVELPLDSRELIEAVMTIMPKDQKYLFPEERAMYLDPRRRANLSTYFRRICEGVGIEGKSFHDLRSTFLTDAAKRGVPIDYIAQMAGHSSTVTTRGYIKE